MIFQTPSQMLSHRGHRRPARLPPRTQLPPMVANALALPGDDGTGLNEHQGVLPGRPQPREPSPEQTRGRVKPRATDGLLVDRQLMPQGQVFQAQGCPRPEEACDASQQSRDDGEHDQKPPHHDLWEDGEVRCSNMKRNAKTVTRRTSFRFSGQTVVRFDDCRGWARDCPELFCTPLEVECRRAEPPPTRGI
jgi:hypothetical protein